MQQILVTGGSGYIGSHTAVELINRNYKVYIIDNLSNSEESVIANIETITGTKPSFQKFDLCDLEKTDAFFQNHKIDAVIHFAAFKAVGESVENPLLYYRNNIVSLLNILSCMKKYNVKKLVFSSSCTVYGEPDKLPVTENSEVKKATSPYGNTKQIAEEIINDFARVNPNFKTVSLRYFNPIGAHESALIGELPLGIPNNLVPFITQTAAGIRSCLSIFGNDYNTPDGTCIRDYINVCDLADAHIAALNRLNNQEMYGVETFNVGTGQGTSVLEIVEAFEKATSQKLNYKITSRRPGDVEKVFADTTNANNMLKWKAQRSLHDTLLSAWKWEKKLRGIE